MKLFLTLNLLIISLFMFSLKHPLSMGLLILIQTLLICLLSGMIIYTYWFSYILFLTFLGGLLVLFIYVSSIASNELFNFSNKSKIFLIFLMASMIMVFYLYNNLNQMNFIFNNNNEVNNFFNSFMFFNNEYNINLSKLYNEQNYFLMTLLIIYLFITLVAVVKITNIFYGPLRSFN
uniref:NADH dehydrogenase subunit 6 n=1 Tax=Pedesta hyrie TaxID=2573075 RepID=UPI0022FD942B|nr:NADH dehydrogenase subunit 6 [Pedesta hyrie]WAX37292.1 NADH dehydrogenase subunit 6 [Pedesta hyrie]